MRLEELALRRSGDEGLALAGDGAAAPAFPRLDGDITADVAVIGGGIVGVTTALLLHEAGVRVVLLEADRIGHGVTGHTTAKVSSQHGLIYARLRSKHGADAARATARPTSRRWRGSPTASSATASTATSAAARPTPTRRRALATSRTRPRRRPRRGCRRRSSRRRRCRIPVAAAVRFDDQAEFHAHKYLLALAAQLPEVYEHTHAVQVGDAVRHARAGA